MTNLLWSHVQTVVQGEWKGLWKTTKCWRSKSGQWEK